MFKLEKKETFAWPVMVNVPQDGGRFATHEFKAVFKLHDQSEMDTLIERLKTDDHDLLKNLVVGWENVSDPNGEPVPFSTEACAKMIDIPYVRTALLKAYFEAASGNKVKKGN